MSISILNTLKEIVQVAEGTANTTVHWVGETVTDVTGWAEERTKDTLNFVGETAQKTLKTAEDVAKIARAINNKTITFAEDAVTRAYLAAKGELNYDIIKDGPLLKSMKDLRPGDILLKQGGIEVTDLGGKLGIEEGVSLIIDGVQIVTNRSNHRYIGAGLLGHAAIYIGSGDVAEAIGAGCTIRELDGDYNKNFNFYAIRPKDEKLAQKIAELAKKYASTNRISYSRSGLPSAVIGGTISSTLSSDLTKLKRQGLDSEGKTSMFCSEFVAFILNCTTDDLGHPRIIAVSQDRITPEEIYVQLRDNPDFSYIGELRKNVR
ncbi:hypothetical protein [Calothrix sp. NIES-2098]|uniref:hypothetical protein n=1 Tax=Calothrix sp. NIES-2098 TaxID=1954171 RepID=UPI000B620C00|nr:hypothetical protein NIES2098_74270 [Calothrix sp. NIES-2098]